VSQIALVMEVSMVSVVSHLRNGLLVASAVLLVACATVPEIRRDTNPAADFASYKTFGYFSPLATDRAGYESVLTSRLKDATRRAMESKGYVYSETHPDLLLNFFANVQEKQEIRSMPTTLGYYGYRRGYYGGFGLSSIETYSYQEGTLTIDLVETKRKLLVWQATAEGTVSSEARRNPGPVIDATVAEMMTPLPAGRLQ
jgi:Domain of unknown function (DUF4136)